MLPFRDDNGSFLSRLARESQKTISAVVRIAAAIERNGKSIAMDQAESASGLSAQAFSMCWPEISPFFRLHAGRIHLRNQASDDPPWEGRDAKLDNHVSKHLSGLLGLQLRLEEDSPKGVLLRNLAGLGVPLETVEKTYYSLTRTYNHDRVAAALRLTKAATPVDPLPYLQQLLRTGRGLDEIRPRPRVVAQFVKPEYIENSRTVLLGWEAPCPPDNTWPAGARRLVYRMRTGHIRYEPPRPGTQVPSLDEDPGVLVRH